MILPLTPVRFKRHATQVYGRKIGVVCGEERFTYSQFNERADRLSNALLQLGLQAGDRVAFLGFNCHRLLEAYYGVPQIQAILLPLNIRLSPEELAFILNDSAPRLLFFDAEFTPLVESLCSKLKPVERYVLLSGQPPAWAHPETYEQLIEAAKSQEIDFLGIDENSVAELFYTSGTTAHPKGVMLTHRNLYLHAFSCAARLRPLESDVALYTVPLFHANSWGTPHHLTMAGGRHVMIRRFEPQTALELIQRERVTILGMVPAMIIALMNYPEFGRYDLSSVRLVTIGGAPSSIPLVQEIERRIPSCVAMGGYGLTETSPVITAADLKSYLEQEPEEIRYRRKATAGLPYPCSEVQVVKADGKEVAHNGRETGEIRVRGDVVAPGYWRQPEETARAMRDGWFYTGDLATVDDEGYILIVDRSKDMILSGGENIGSAEVERVIYAHPAVLECAVIAVPDEKWGEVPKAIVTLRHANSTTEEEILCYCRKHLAGFKVPQSVEFRDYLPKGGTGKILKRTLREPYWAGHDRKVH
ncbi:MAG: fatty acid--CoA ligase [Terriglobia bacterium]